MLTQYPNITADEEAAIRRVHALVEKAVQAGLKPSLEFLGEDLYRVTVEAPKKKVHTFNIRPNGFITNFVGLQGILGDPESDDDEWIYE